MTAMKALAAVARNRSLTAILSSPAPVQALRLEGDADLVVVAWVSGEGRIVDVPAPTPLSATDIYGAPLDLTPRDGRITLTLEESKGPVYLLYEDHGVIGDEGVDGRTDDVGAGDAGAEVDGADEDDGDAPGGCGCLMI
jgi:hypothetical protein